MAGTTSRYGLALMSGGSDDPSPDEVADVKVINDGLKLIDGFLGVKECTSGTRPASPKLGQFIVESDTGLSLYWSGTVWTQFGPKSVPTVLASLLQGAVTVANTGALITVSTLTWTAPIAQRALISVQTTLTAGANIAGYLQVFLNGTQIGTGYRVANFAATTPVAFSRNVKGLVVAGSNTVLVRMTAEAGGVSYTANNTNTEVWAD